MNSYKGKGKFWDNENHVIGKSFKRINENQWFKTQQPLLLWMANQDYGRDLLCIPKNFPKIIEISKKHITGHLGFEKVGKDQYIQRKISDFRMGSKWANIIRHRWQEFQAYAQEYYALQRKPVFFPVSPRWNFAYTTSTFYPDPSPESTSVDGRAGHGTGGAYNDTFANIIAAAGDGASDGDADTTAVYLAASTTTNQFATLYRGIFLFDTSSLPDTDTINSGTFSLWGTAKSNGLGGADLHLVSSAPASNTAVVAGDYDSLGSTSYGNVAYASFDATNTVYTDITINATGLATVSKTGDTKFGCKNSWDQAGSFTGSWASGAEDNLNSKFADQAGTSNDPKLVIVHSAAATAANFMLLGVGT